MSPQAKLTSRGLVIITGNVAGSGRWTLGTNTRRGGCRPRWWHGGCQVAASWAATALAELRFGREPALVALESSAGGEVDRATFGTPSVARREVPKRFQRAASPEAHRACPRDRECRACRSASGFESFSAPLLSMAQRDTGKFTVAPLVIVGSHGQWLGWLTCPLEEPLSATDRR